MSVEIEWADLAVEDLEELPEDVRKRVEDKVEELKDKATSHRDVKLIRDPRWGEVWRLKVKDDRANHRVFFDILDSAIVEILRIYHRDVAYDTEQP